MRTKGFTLVELLVGLTLLGLLGAAFYGIHRDAPRLPSAGERPAGIPPDDTPARVDHDQIASPLAVTSVTAPPGAEAAPPPSSSDSLPPAAPTGAR